MLIRILVHRPHLTNLRMKDMMAVLVWCISHSRITVHHSDATTSSLKDVPDPKKIAPDGQTIEGRMKTLCETVAEDIQLCANACDAYLK